MLNKKNFLLNCEVCDTRKMKEEDYSHFEKMLINTELLLVNESSKSILNRLPVTINQTNGLALPNDMDMELKTVNGSYEITGNTAVAAHTLLIVNGSLQIQPGTEEVLAKYENITVNGSVKCPKSLEGYLGKISVNGSVSTYPDDCVLLDETFTLDKYFPLRAKEGGRYYAENLIVIPDPDTDLRRLTQKQVRFITDKLLVHEENLEDCVPLFDERTAFIIVPKGMKLICGDTVLSRQLLEKEGGSLYVYGSVKLDENCAPETLGEILTKLIVKGTVTLRKSQEEAFQKLDTEYDRLEYVWEGRLLENKASLRVDKSLLENSPQGVLVRNAALVKIAEDVTPELILDKLTLANCAKVFCSEAQESAVAAIAQNVAQIGESGGNALQDALGSFQDMLSTKIVNAEYYVM